MQNLTYEQYAVCGDNIADDGDASIYFPPKFQSRKYRQQSEYLPYGENDFSPASKVVTTYPKNEISKYRKMTSI